MKEEKGSADQHKEWAAEQIETVKLAIVTVSDSRTPETDTNYHFLAPAIAEIGHEVCGYRIIKDEPEQVVSALNDFAGVANIIFFNGGTGISRRDTTYDALAGRLEKTLVGFGEIFRMLSWEQVGSAAMFSRATAGVYQGSVVVSTPGSPKAVKLAWEKLIKPELRHLAWEVGR